MNTLPALHVKLLDPAAKAPTVTNPGTDLGYDLYAIEDAVLTTGVPTKLRTGFAMAFTNKMIGGLLRDRSSMAAKGIIVSGGVIDTGYRGEVLVVLTYTVPCIDGNGSMCPHSYQIKAGDKIAQLIPFPCTTFMQVEVSDELPAADRGEKGFGSSGR